MWTTSTPKYSEIKNVRASLSSFAAQISIQHAVLQAKRAVKPENGLHIRLTAKSDSGASKNPIQSEWKDIGANTVSQVSKIIHTHEPFLFDFLSCIASGTSDNQILSLTYSEAVTHSIAALNFCLNRQANWLPVARGILYFSSSAPVDLFAYESRIGTMPAYGTNYRVLRELGFAEGLATELAGKNPKRWVNSSSTMYKTIYDNATCELDVKTR
ncbi:uncharacterized protein C8R40DRAFT_1167737 [Lentinula edodes]|uniref:uncharacterized protein n=1 Tax=Lentinula edodes TaxID=5353 RepID=UPI001E8C9FA8|nr:uncharacterized protein C8R40DRAFT_1167737 [Lentinula edodes]KAH7878316.1 hypothetical protein C8R40DRAFT_1167737 [Lentinula edodes]